MEKFKYAFLKQDYHECNQALSRKKNFEDSRLINKKQRKILSSKQDF